MTVSLNTYTSAQTCCYMCIRWGLSLQGSSITNESKQSRVCPCESPLTANASGEIFTGIRQAPDRKNESMLCSTSSIAWKSGSYSIAITQNYIAVWNKAYSEGCALDEGWVPAVQANWTGSICCAGSAAELQSAPVGCRTATGRSHMGSSTPLPSHISAHSVWCHWKRGHCIYK